MSEPEELREALAAAAAGHYGHPVEIDGPRPLLGGSSRELWSFDALVGAERHPLVLRRDPPGVEDPESPQAAMFHTYRWLSAVQDSLVTALLD